jgi:short-subunit dehydrogenase
MFAQGFWGLVTSMNPEDVARIAFRAALRGRFLVIPGWINQWIHAISSLVPQAIATKYVAKRWSAARSKQEDPLVIIGNKTALC